MSQSPYDPGMPPSPQDGQYPQYPQQQPYPPQQQPYPQQQPMPAGYPPMAQPKKSKVGTIVAVALCLVVIAVLALIIRGAFMASAPHSGGTGTSGGSTQATQTTAQGASDGDIWCSFPGDDHITEAWYADGEWDRVTSDELDDTDLDIFLTVSPTLSNIYSANSAGAQQAYAFDTYARKVLATKSWPTDDGSFGTPETCCTNPRLWVRNARFALEQTEKEHPGTWKVIDMVYPIEGTGDPTDAVYVTLIGMSPENMGMRIECKATRWDSDPQVTSKVNTEQRYETAKAVMDGFKAHPVLAGQDWYFIMPDEDAAPALIVNTASNPDLAQLQAAMNDVLVPAGYESGNIITASWETERPGVHYYCPLGWDYAATYSLTSSKEDIQCYLLSGYFTFLCDEESASVVEWSATPVTAPAEEPSQSTTPVVPTDEPQLTYGDPSHNPVETLANTGTFVTGPTQIGSSSADGPYHCYWIRNYGNGLVVPIAQLIYMPDGKEPDGLINDGAVAKINKYMVPQERVMGATGQPAIATPNGTACEKNTSANTNATVVSWTRTDVTGTCWAYDLYLYEELDDATIGSIVDSIF